MATTRFDLTAPTVPGTLRAWHRNLGLAVLIPLALALILAASPAFAQRWDDDYGDEYGDEYDEGDYGDVDFGLYAEDEDTPVYDDDFDGAGLGYSAEAAWKPFQSAIGAGFLTEKNDDKTTIYQGLGEFYLRSVRPRSGWPLGEAAFLDRTSAIRILGGSADTTRDGGAVKFDLSGQVIMGEIDIRGAGSPLAGALEFTLIRLSVYDASGAGITGAEGDLDSIETKARLGYYTTRTNFVFLELGQGKDDTDLRFSSGGAITPLKSEAKNDSRGIGLKSVFLRPAGTTFVLNAAVRMETEKDSGTKDDSTEFELGFDWWIDPRVSLGAKLGLTQTDKKDQGESVFGLKAAYNTPAGLGLTLELERIQHEAAGVKDITAIELNFLYRF